MPEQNDSQIFLMLGRIEAKLDSYSGLHDTLAKEVSELNKRLTTLENDKTKAITTFGVLRVGLLMIGTAIGMFASQIIKLVLG